MKKYISLYMLLGVFACMFGFSACNESSDDDIVDNSSEFAVMVKSFSLQADDSILENLDSVFFSIDLDRATVFNADSLPRGTRVDSLHVNITFSTVSKAEITMPGSTEQDTVVDYLTNAGTAIDFSRGYVTLHLESSNGQANRDYRIYVNVHNMAPDSLCWGSAAFSDYPTDMAAPTAMKAVDFGGKAICFATDGSRTTRAISANSDISDWAVEPVELPAGLDIATVTVGPSALFALDKSSTLYTSADEGLTWTSTGSAMTHIYGAYGSSLLGNRREADGSYVYVTYPETTAMPVPAGAPVSGTSQSLVFTSQWASEPMFVTLGGATASGEFVGSVWAYDGTEWNDISVSPMPAVRDVTIVPYFAIKVGTSWVATTHTALLAFGGTNAEGVIDRTLYISLDRGVHWSRAGRLMQLPEQFPELTGAQALVFERTLTASSHAAQRWSTLELPEIPAWYTLLSTTDDGIKPVTSWDCPYIYVFGGRDQLGRLNTSVWRGVINRLSFKPIQ